MREEKGGGVSPSRFSPHLFPFFAPATWRRLVSGENNMAVVAAKFKLLITLGLNAKIRDYFLHFTVAVSY